MITQLRINIDWVGYIDWTVRDFHGYETRRGATYNSYLVRDEKIALIDAVKAPYVDTLLRNIGRFTKPDKIDYVVVNHAESDHASGLPGVLVALGNPTVLCTKKCSEILGMHHDTSGWNIQTVSSGDTLSLGKRTLHFLETPMLHWPDSMFTYIPEEKLLFSMDAFGQHLASSGRFDDEVPLQVVMEEAKIYYANIVMPFPRQVKKALDAASGLDIDTIAPSHGVIWRSHIPDILKAYSDWSGGVVQPKVLVIYDTMWDSTGAMARAIAEGASLPGVDVRLIAIRSSNITTIATEILDAATIAFGSATLNQGMMPQAGAVLTYLKGLKPTGKSGFAFGSFGWGKGGPEEVDEILKTMKFDILREPIKSQFKPTETVLDECREAGKILAEKALEMSSSSAPD